MPNIERSNSAKLSSRLAPLPLRPLLIALAFEIRCLLTLPFRYLSLYRLHIGPQDPRSNRKTAALLGLGHMFSLWFKRQESARLASPGP